LSIFPVIFSTLLKIRRSATERDFGVERRALADELPKFAPRSGLGNWGIAERVMAHFDDARWSLPCLALTAKSEHNSQRPIALSAASRTGLSKFPDVGEKRATSISISTQTT
jgi:hypothetical protein